MYSDGTGNIFFSKSRNPTIAPIIHTMSTIAYITRLPYPVPALCTLPVQDALQNGQRTGVGSLNPFISQAVAQQTGSDVIGSIRTVVQDPYIKGARRFAIRIGCCLGAGRPCKCS